jgi:hypothetical protein
MIAGTSLNAAGWALTWDLVNMVPLSTNWTTPIWKRLEAVISCAAHWRLCTRQVSTAVMSITADWLGNYTKCRSQVVSTFTRSLNRALENLYLGNTGCAGTGTGIELRCKNLWYHETLMKTMYFTLSLLRFHAEPLTQFGVWPATPFLKTLSTGITCCYFVARQAEPNIPAWRRSPELKVTA